MDIVTIILELVSIVLLIAAMVIMVKVVKSSTPKSFEDAGMTTFDPKWVKKPGLIASVASRFLTLGAIMIVFGAMIASIFTIAEQLGYCIHEQVMSLWMMTGKPCRIAVFIWLICCGIYMIGWSIGFEKSNKKVGC